MQTEPRHGLSERSQTKGRDSYDVVVVGAGFAGLYMLHRVRELGLTARVFERGDGVGGTWYWNRYPGARCDTDSLQYSYTFSDELQREWDWSERYAAQPEILRYANFVADRLNLRHEIELNTDVKACLFNEAAGTWSVATSDGKTVTARFVVLATGLLSSSRAPEIAGLDTFGGSVYHTGNWPHQSVDFTGMRVGVLGTGSSGIQVIPQLAKQAGHLTVFQRTANFSVPARNRPLTEEDRREYRTNFPEIRRFLREESKAGVYPTTSNRGTFEDDEEAQRATYEAWWSYGGAALQRAYNDLFVNKAANDVAADFVRSKIAEIVKDEKTAKLLQPHTHPIACKRLPVDINYFETFNRPNVTLVDIRSDLIQEMVHDGLRTSHRFFELDALVLATGFDAVTGSVAKIDIRGRGGLALNRKWADAPKGYLGLMVAGFPNLFTISGPGGPSAVANGIIAVELHVEWIADCLQYMRDRNLDLIEADRDAEEKWTADCNDLVKGTLLMEADTWWNGSNVPGKPRVFLAYVGGLAAYRKTCNEVAAKGYEGFVMMTSAKRTTQSIALS